MSHTQIYQFLTVVVILVAGATLAAQDSIDRDYSAELQRIPPTEPADALKTFEVAKGYQLQLAAAEPLVTSPVAASFDEDGRLYVVEMRDYSEQDKEKLGRIRRMEDTNGDGVFDKSVIFAEGLSWPTAIICYDGGVFVGAAPEILYLKDTDGDNQADVRRVIFTGFGRGNVQGLLNSFCWGLDNRIHVAISTAGAELQHLDANGQPTNKPLTLRGRDFAFDPRNPASFIVTSGGGQHGMCFDDWGRKFVCSNSDHIQLIMLEDADLARNPYLVPPNPRISIAADGPQADVFRISPVEPWREIRTRLRTKGIVPGIVEGGGRAAGYFTGATGITIYRGNAWPKADHGLAIVGDVGGNLVHRKRLEPNGVELIAKRIDEKKEFVASRDTWFRPVQFFNAPDGTLYILDMYREVIEHPASLPPVIKKHLDLTSGRDRGRIYRIVPEGFSQPKLPQLSKASTAELVALLEHENGWHRDTAQRLLYERQDANAIEMCGRLISTGRSPLGRMHALYAIDDQHAQDDGPITIASQDADDGVRIHALRIARRQRLNSSVLLEKMLAACDDRNPLVRLEACWMLGDVSDTHWLAVLKRMREDTSNRWIRAAISVSMVHQCMDLLVAIYADKDLVRDAKMEPWLNDFLAQVPRESDADLDTIIGFAVALSLKSEEGFERFVRTLGTQGPSSLPKLQAVAASSVLPERQIARLAPIFQAEALDDKRPLKERLQVIPLVALDKSNGSAMLLKLLTIQEPVEVQSIALAALFALRPKSGEEIIAKLDQVSPAVREQAIAALLSDDAMSKELLAALQAKKIEIRQLNEEQRLLLNLRPDDVQKSVNERLSQTTPERGEIIAAYQDSLKLTGDTTRGAELFKKQCSQCHKVGDLGHEIGPNLAAMKNKGAEAILVNVLDPNREVNPQFVSYVVLTKDGRAISGLISAETATSLTLKKADNQTETVLRIDIEELKSTGLSLMPVGLEQQLNPQQLADVIAFLLKPQ